MSKYFVKYLPVEGEIKKGDKLFDPPMHRMGVMEALTDNEGIRIKAKGGTKVKLFLCSRDIDWTKCTTLETHIPFKQKDENDLPFQVIGEISPEATWVKEGDEFDESSVSEVWQGTDNVVGTDAGPDDYYKNLNHPSWFKIKGPCGHFH